MPDWLSPRLIFPLLHASLGYGLALTLWYRLLPVGRTWAIVAGYAIGVVLLLKESLWDPRNEPGQPFWPEGVTDLAFYALGALVAAITIAA